MNNEKLNYFKYISEKATEQHKKCIELLENENYELYKVEVKKHNELLVKVNKALKEMMLEGLSN